jgi:hypothetical protein
MNEISKTYDSTYINVLSELYIIKLQMINQKKINEGIAKVDSNRVKESGKKP